MPVRLGRDRKYDRPEHDFVPTPAEPINALLNIYKFSPVICDPCCGDGALLNILRARGYRAVGTDIRHGSCDETIACDFIHDPWPIEWPADIVTNPPYGLQGRLAERFIDRALEITRPYRGRVAMLLSSDFDSAGGRTMWFRDNPAFACRVVLLNRIRWYPGPVTCKACAGTGFDRFEGGGLSDTKCRNCKGTGEKMVGPAENHTWYIWDHEFRGGPSRLPAVRYAGWRE
jgi:hypothetical protein